ncbi:PQQ-binding-like beta-propeller repeat protein [Gluconacetobacter diazotrophicus]|uniref:PQQ-binding-like beta-propeller repeat protein n=1 Tax=Gluconacetobacter diazotrophicus TaxID=33996 RepID=A0A7W4I8Q0_GLUDI|nr:PQQ-binding-like beta-propeller repeat protein [Gluconacetobacter diazotrophicus]MBB2158284.1 PQQ-binding-like beta-propeller repeat protein [Gluconacetobacter diazotrophicus]
MLDNKVDCPEAGAVIQNIHDFIEATCIIRGDEERLIGRSDGGALKWLIDLRPLFLNPKMLEAIANVFWETNRTKLPFQVAGLEVAAIPLLTAILMQGAKNSYDVSGLIIRKERKRYGRGRVIEGELNGNPIIVVDDIFNSGASMRKVFSILAAEGYHASSVFVLIDYRSSSGLRWTEENEVEISSIYTLSDFGMSIENSSKKYVKSAYKKAWSFRSNDGSPFSMVPKSAPVYSQGMVVFGTDKGTVICLDSSSGTIRWKVSLPNTGRKGIWSSACVHGEYVYIGAYNGNVYCFELRTGNEVWVNYACEWIGSSPICVPQLGLVYIGFEYEHPRTKGGIAALDMRTGTKRWEFPLSQYQHGSSIFFASGNAIITGTNDHNVISLDAESGAHKWTFETKRSVKYAPSIDNERGLVAFASYDKSIYVLDASTGVKRLEVQTDGLCYTSPLFSDGRLFCGSGDRRLYVVDVDNMRPIGRLDLKARVYASPRRLGGQIVVGTTGGVLYFIDEKSLDVIDQIQLPDAITNAIAIGEHGSFYVTTYMNDIHAFDLAEVK